MQAQLCALSFFSNESVAVAPWVFPADLWLFGWCMPMPWQWCLNMLPCTPTITVLYLDVLAYVGTSHLALISICASRFRPDKTNSHTDLCWRSGPKQDTAIDTVCCNNQWDDFWHQWPEYKRAISTSFGYRTQWTKPVAMDRVKPNDAWPAALCPSMIDRTEVVGFLKATQGLTRSVHDGFE